MRILKLILLLNLCINSIICIDDDRIITTLKYSKTKTIPTIVNGRPANLGEFPFIVSIKSPSKTTNGIILWSNFCGGSIISLKKVLTAAHCFELYGFYYYHNPERLRIVAGDLKPTTIPEDSKRTKSQWRKIDKIILHNGFHFPMNDIALVFIDKEWNFKPNVDFINTARVDMDYSICRSAGYGVTGLRSNSSTPKSLLATKIITIPRYTCTLIWEIDMSNFICSSSAESDVAYGDSGGPLVCSETYKVLAGIVSGKNFDKTTLFTRVSAYSSWIDSDKCQTPGGNVILVVFLDIILLFVVCV